jgi:hypothetical protein
VYNGAVPYSVRTELINPANPNLFTVLARIVSVFEMFLFTLFELEWSPEAPTGTTGQVGFMFDPEATDLAPPSRNAFENQSGSVVGPLYEALRCKMKIPTTARAAFFFVADSMDSGTDPRVTNQGLCSWFTADSVVSTPLGQVFVKYKVSLMMPTINPSAGPSIGSGPAYFVGGSAATNLAGAALSQLMCSINPVATTGAHSSLPGTMSCVAGSNNSFAVTMGGQTTSATTLSNRILLPFSGTPQSGWTSIAGSYVVCLWGTCAAASVFTVTPVSSAVTVHTSPAWNGSLGYAVNPNAVTSNTSVSWYRVDVVAGVGGPYSTQTNAGGGITEWSGAPAIDFYMTGTGNVYLQAQYMVFPLAAGGLLLNSGVRRCMSRYGLITGDRFITATRRVVVAFDGVTIDDRVDGSAPVSRVPSLPPALVAAAEADVAPAARSVAAAATTDLRTGLRALLDASTRDQKEPDPTKSKALREYVVVSTTRP